jgi:hypothetical protein
MHGITLQGNKEPAMASPYEISRYDDGPLMDQLKGIKEIALKRWDYHENPFRRGFNSPYTLPSQHHPLTSAIEDVKQQMANVVRLLNRGTYRDEKWHGEYGSLPLTIEQEAERLDAVRDRVRVMLEKWATLISLFGDESSLHKFVR